MVGALPRLKDGFAAGRFSVCVHLPEPFTAGAFVHHHVADVVVNIGGGIAVFCIAALVVFVHEAQHAFGLHPPHTGGVHLAAVALVDHRVVNVSFLVDVGGKVGVDGVDAFGKRCISQ